MEGTWCIKSSKSANSRSQSLCKSNKCHHQKSGSKYIYSTNTNQFVLTTKPNGNPELEDWRDGKNFTDLTFPGLPYLLAKVLSILYFLSFYAAEILIGIMYLHYHGVIYRHVSTSYSFMMFMFKWKSIPQGPEAWQHYAGPGGSHQDSRLRNVQGGNQRGGPNKGWDLEKLAHIVIYQYFLDILRDAWLHCTGDNSLSGLRSQRGLVSGESSEILSSSSSSPKFKSLCLQK